MAKVTLDQIGELIAQSKSGRITKAAFQRFLDTPTLAVVASSAVIVPTTDFDRWKKLYLDNFGIDVDVTAIVIPPRPAEGKWRLIVVAAGLTVEAIFQKCREKFGAWKYTSTDLDKAVPTNDRCPNRDGGYAIWVRDVIEADEEFKNLSADDITAKKIKAVTLRERLLHEIDYFDETGKHLDVINWTLCAGSRDSGGSVVRVGWSVDELNVYYYDTRLSDDKLRVREAVSNPLSLVTLVA